MTAGLLTTASAQEITSQETLSLGRADQLLRQKAFDQAMEELGRLPKEFHEDPLFRGHLGRAAGALYRTARRRTYREGLAPFRGRAAASVRVTHRKQDSGRNSDQTSDNRGWQINERLETTLGREGRINARFLQEADGFKNGHRDLRYRTLLVDFFNGSSHLALGDSASYGSPYFLRGSRLRGADLLLRGETHELQLVAGGYPFWLESRDEYIYPRTVWGFRDKWNLMGERVSLGAGLMQARDSEKIRTIDTANRPRDNVVYSLEQAVRLVPDVWWLKAYEAYSVTDDDLLEERFGNARKLKDTAFRLESDLIQPFLRWRSRYERTGPEFRLLTDIPSGSVVNAKGITADREFIQQYLDLAPLGPLDLDLEASWYRNSLDGRDNVEQTRQRWATVEAGFLVPEGWPKPRVRGTATETLSSPGSATRASQTRTFDVRTDLTHRLGDWSLNGFGTFKAEHPLKDKTAFDEQTSWSAGSQISRPLGKRLYWTSRYEFRFFDEVFDETRIRDHSDEINNNLSVRLWSTASLGLHHSFLRGMLRGTASAKKIEANRHTGSASLSWPYVWTRADKRRRLTIHPSLAYYVSNVTNSLERRPMASGGLRLAYEAYPDWKLELNGNFRWDDDGEADEVRTEESRVWLSFTTLWP
ncbi:MAG: hypothetical protein HYS41_04460 [Candidatus Omnitrophica bacterium]|nr:hypothetical protein [Candidatus Omnitrophota bacterium]